MSIVIAVDGTAASGKGTLGQEAGGAFRFRPSGFRRALSPDRAGGAGGRGRSQERSRRGPGRPDHRSQPWPAIPPSAPIWSGRPPPMSPPFRRCARRCWISSRTFSPIPPGGSPGAVMDGRDIGTVICPAATAKLYVDARPEVRARRRWLELKGMGIRRDEAGCAGRTQCPGRGRQIPPDCPPETGPGRRLAGYLGFGYRRARSRQPSPWSPQRSRARSRTATGAKEARRLSGIPLTLPKPTRAHGARMGSPAARTPIRHDTLFEGILNGPRRIRPR